MNAQAHELVLDGCAPTPLSGYLKGLGVLRLLGEQKPEWDIRGAWRKDKFVLKSTAFSGDQQVDRQCLQIFFLDEYHPTPIVAPWNGGSGFYPKDNRDGIDAIVQSGSARFSIYREVIDYGRNLIERLNLQKRPDNEEEKASFLAAIRADAPEALLAWMDAAVLLGGDKPRYPPLLGTGGNDGRLDFTNNFMQRIANLIDPESGNCTAAAESWLPATLFGEAAPKLANSAIGQFNPGGAGGPNAGAGFEADSLINPWDFVLMLEGAVFFAASIARRLETSEPGMLSYPFTVRSTGAGNGALDAADENQARAEIWLPLWSGFASIYEIRMLLNEGRATLGRRPVRDGLGFARAVAALGVDRGVTAFQRYGFLMRSGKAYLATPLTRVTVRRNPDADLIAELEKNFFLDRLRQFARKDEAPATIRAKVRQLEDALFELAQRSEPRALQKVIVHLGALSLLLGKSRKGRESVPPVPTLSEAWIMKAYDGTSEFRIAAAIAGLGGNVFPMRPFIIPVVQKEKTRSWDWNIESRLAVWGEGDLAANIIQVIARRRLEALQEENKVSTFQYHAGVKSGDVAAWLEQQVDDARIAGLYVGLVHARIPKHFASLGERVVLPAAYRVLKPFFTPDEFLISFKLLPPDNKLPLPGEIVAKLQANRVQEAVNVAWRRLHAVGYPLPPYPKAPPSAQGLNGQCLLATLAVPLESAELVQCLNLITREKSIATA